MDLWEAFNPALPAGINEANIDGFKKKEFLYLYSVDKWYNVLKELTFETEFVDLHLEYANRQPPSVITPFPGKMEAKTLMRVHGVLCGYDPAPITENEQNNLDSVQNRIESAIERIRAAAGDASAAVFIKLNHRSPKDVAIERKNQRTIAELLEQLKSVSRRDKIGQAIALDKALVRSLSCSTAAEALELLLRSSRVRLDLSQDTEYPEFYKSQIVVRRFYQNIDPTMEFRAFVRDHQLTAVSQYEEFYFPHLIKRKEEVQRRIVEFFNQQVSPRIQQAGHLPASYVIDFAIVDDRVMVIELNPFHSNTSGSLFSWTNDRNVILNGPLEFRFVEQPSAAPSELIPWYFQQEMDQFYKKNREGVWIQHIVWALAMGGIFFTLSSGTASAAVEAAAQQIVVPS